MNCNSNTTPLIDSSANGCNNGCIPKEINIICRKIIIPSGQEILAVQGDNNSSTRTFILPDTTEDGIDLTDKSFMVLVENSNREQWKTPVKTENIEILDNYIKIKWIVGANETAVSGNLSISIEANGDNFKWQTYAATFLIKQSLENKDNEIAPPLNLQEKHVTPNNESMDVVPDYGYNGLSKVIVDGDNNLIPENIKSGISIFGIMGNYE